MLGISSVPLFVGAVMLLNITPGPDMAYVAGQTIARGRAAGMRSALGLVIGGSMHTLACAFGLSALIAASPTAFAVIKWVGAAYLVFIGLQTLRATARTTPAAEATDALALSRSLLVRGLITNVTNPKVFLFYIAFLPQFVSPDSPHKTAALLVLGAMLVTLGFFTDCVIVYGAARASGLVRKSATLARWLNRVVGAGFIGLGLRLAVTTRWARPGTCSYQATLASTSFTFRTIWSKRSITRLMVAHPVGFLGTEKVLTADTAAKRERFNALRGCPQ